MFRYVLERVRSLFVEPPCVDVLFYMIVAAESMHALPDIEVNIVEYSEVEHNTKNGIYREISSAVIADSLNVEKKNEDDIIGDDKEVLLEAITVATATAPSKKKKNTTDVIKEDKDMPSDAAAGSGAPSKKKKKAAENVPKEKGQMYYLVSCKDNGCGTSCLILVAFIMTLFMINCFSVSSAEQMPTCKICSSLKSTQCSKVMIFYTV